MWKTLGALLLLPAVSLAAPPPPDPPSLCERAAATAEFQARVPARLLDAIAVTETGRPDEATGRRRAWPWTINAQGEGRYYDTKQQAVAAAQAMQAAGVASIDVGCMQVNLMHHPDAFASLDDAFDPVKNAIYAAKFLNALYAVRRDWALAVGDYHSETPALGDAYRVLVMARWQGGPESRTAETAGPYGDFAPARSAYGAFAPASSVYGAFAPAACGPGRCPGK